MTIELTTQRPVLPVLPEVDEAAARRALREQIAGLEAELATAVVSNGQRAPLCGGGGAPRLLDLGDLERVRDELAVSLRAVQRAAGERGEREESYRRLREELLLEPERHPFVRISNEDVGEPGCHDWHVRPRFGLLGMLMRWWRVRISSGCP